MPEERETGRAPEERKETSGEYLWRVLKPAGCIVVLLLFIVYLVFCFTYRSDPGGNDGAAETAVPAMTDTINQ